MSGIAYLSMLSAACRAGLPELCTDASCENWQHDGDDLEPLTLSPEAEDAAALEYDRRAEMRESTR